MRLINTRTLHLEEFSQSSRPRYAILSHKWEDEEVSYDQYVATDVQKLAGYAKIDRACQTALRMGYDYLWIDTCCINKSSSSELGEAINSMYAWYQRSAVCIVFLQDFTIDGTSISFEQSQWFTRGWTLQELIAPQCLLFYDRHWRYVGDKAQLKAQISQVTGIDQDVLRGEDPALRSVAQRMSWAARRVTTRIEDRAYCLLGLFGVSLPMLYGEGERAFPRLIEEIMSKSDDHSVFCWDRNFTDPGRPCSLLPASPACFEHCGHITRSDALRERPKGFSLTNVGVSIDLITLPYAMETYLAVLECTHRDYPEYQYGILLQRLTRNRQYARVVLNNRPLVSIRRDILDTLYGRKRRPLLVRQNIIDPPPEVNYAIWIRTLVLPEYTDTQLSRAKIFSRDGRVSYSNGPITLVIPDGYCGTAGIIRLLPQSSSADSSWSRIRTLKLGFNEDFRPSILLGNHKYNVRAPGRAYEQMHEILSDSTWLKRGSTSSTKPDFKRFNHCVVEADNKEYYRQTLRELNLCVEMELIDCPEGLPGLRASPWKVWCVDLFEADPQSPQQKKAIAAAGGLSGLMGTLALVDVI